jgi:hypothetical protein
VSNSFLKWTSRVAIDGRIAGCRRPQNWSEVTIPGDYHLPSGKARSPGKSRAVALADLRHLIEKEDRAPKPGRGSFACSIILIMRIRVQLCGLMSALGQKRTLRRLIAMTALPPIADIYSRASGAEGNLLLLCNRGVRPWMTMPMPF